MQDFTGEIKADLGHNFDKPKNQGLCLETGSLKDERGFDKCVHKNAAHVLRSPA